MEQYISNVMNVVCLYSCLSHLACKSRFFLHRVIFSTLAWATVLNFYTWFSDRASWIDYKLNTNLMHLLLFIHKILFSSTCFEPQVLIFRRIQLYTCSIWYCHSLWEFLVACRYTTWVRTDWKGKVVGGCLQTPTNNLPPPVSDSTICCMCTTVSSWRRALEARNM